MRKGAAEPVGSAAFLLRIGCQVDQLRRGETSTGLVVEQHHLRLESLQQVIRDDDTELVVFNVYSDIDLFNGSQYDSPAVLGQWNLLSSATRRRAPP